MSTATTASKRTILRSAFGSRAEVVRVFSYDAGRGTACVLLRSQFGDGDSHECVSLSDLEAIDAGNCYTSVSAELKRRAEHKVN